MKILKEEKGLLSLEACISLMIFIFLMLYLYSFFEVFEARNQMAHVVLSVADSIALDGLSDEILSEDSGLADVIYEFYETVISENDFNNNISVEDMENDVEKLIMVIENRFTAYLSNGDSDKADEILKNYGIKEGMAGLDFSKSKVEDGNIYINVVYEMEYEFNTFGQDTVKLEQSACSKIWE